MSSAETVAEPYPQLRAHLDKYEFETALEILQTCDVDSFRADILLWVFDAFLCAQTRQPALGLQTDAGIATQTVLQIVEELLKNNLDLNVEHRSRSLLLAGVETGNPDIVSILLKHGADPNLVLGEEDIGPLGLAVFLCYHDIVTTLLHNGADVNKACYQGLSPLQLSVDMDRSIGISKLLIENGANVQSVLDFHPGFLSSSVLVELLQSKKDYFASMLLDHGEVINNFPDADMYRTYPPLIRAILSRNLHLASVLLEMGENVNQSFGEGLDTPLHIAVKTDNIDMIKTLVKYGANMDVVNGRGHTALGCALQPDKPEDTARALLDLGCSRTKKSIIALFQREFLPIQIAAYRGIFNIVKYLLEDDPAMFRTQASLVECVGDLSLESLSNSDVKKTNDDLLQEYVNTRASDGSTSLYMAVLGGNIKIMHYLLEMGGEPDVICCHGNLVHAAVLSSSSVELLELCLSFGCDVNLYSEYANTPLLLAARTSDVRLLTRLVEEGALLNRKDRFGETALSASVYFGCEENAKVLVAHGADTGIADCRGTTALYWCIFNSREKLLKLLIEAGTRLTLKQLNSYPKNLTVMRNAALMDWVQQQITQPRLLQHCCSIVVRRHLQGLCRGKSIMGSLMSLPLPLKLREYLSLLNASI
ncbi:hypothetical protein ScPMuIL_002654 [Solemya velum]